MLYLQKLIQKMHETFEPLFQQLRLLLDLEEF